jgi:hypothetical protein
MKSRDPFAESGPKETTVTRNHPARFRALSVLMLALSLASPALAEEAAEEESPFSGVFQLDFTNAYFFRGIRQEREGTIFQPWMELYYSLYSSDDGPIRGITVGAGIWNSFHSERTGAVNGPQWLYETDLYPLISVAFPGNVTLTTIYYYYSSPNAAFVSTQELNFKLGWDDSDTFGKFAVHPWINFAIETENTSFGPNTGQGFQLGIAPVLYASEAERYAVTVSAPCEAGFAIHDYYENAGGGENFFGYANVGLLVSLPLSFMPENAGSWTLSASGKYYAFSETLENANRGKSTYPVGMLSLGVAF